MTQFQPSLPHSGIAVDRPIIGYAAAFMTVLIWSGYFLSLRFGVLSPLSKVDLSLIRYTVPGLLLLPSFIKSLKVYRTVPLRWLLGIVIGSGSLFFLASMVGINASNVMFGATLIPGTLPLFVLPLAYLLFRQHLTRYQGFGIGFILAGFSVMAVSGALQFGEQALVAIGMLLVASLLWSVFTLSVRKAMLKPLEVAAMVTVPNGLLIALWAIPNEGLQSLSLLSPQALAIQVLMQSLVVGIFSGLFYSLAIRKIGAEKTATIGAATPLVATLGAFIFLQESLDILPLLGVCLTAVGVVVAAKTQPNN